MKRISPQYIAALGPPGAMSGTGATAWGLWSVDPGATMPPVASCLKQDYAVLIVIGVEDKGR